MKRAFKAVGKWALILALIYVGYVFISGLDLDSRLGWVAIIFGVSIAYMDGTFKDRIKDLEFRIGELERRNRNSPL